MMVMHRGTQDYIGCRCCLYYGAFAGLELGTTAIEKYLKAMLLFNNSAIKVRSHSHDVLSLAKAAEHAGLFDPTPFQTTLERQKDFYNARYPDNVTTVTSYSTGELAAVDALMHELMVRMPLPLEVKLRSGIPPRIVHDGITTVEFPDRNLLLQGNPYLLGSVSRLQTLTTSWLEYDKASRR